MISSFKSRISSSTYLLVMVYTNTSQVYYSFNSINLFPGNAYFVDGEKAPNNMRVYPISHSYPKQMDHTNRWRTVVM